MAGAYAAGQKPSEQRQMNAATAGRLLSINKAFYARYARSFLETRRRPQPGFWRLKEFLPQACHRLLDVGSADGRLGRFLLQEGAIDAYTGVDFSRPLLEASQHDPRMQFIERDLSALASLTRLGTYDAVISLATLQHIPLRSSRVRLLSAMRDCLSANGPIIVSTWQFLENERQRRKITPWARVGLRQSDVEANDYLLTWRRDGAGVRYVCYIDLDQLRELAEASGLRVQAHFRSDGKEGDLNLYAMLESAVRGIGAGSG